MGTCFSLEGREQEQEQIQEDQKTPWEDIVDDKHRRYMTAFESVAESNQETHFWGMGIENESYLMFKTMLGLEFFKKLQRKRERYSVDYYKNFKKEELDRLFETLYTCSHLTYPIYLNSHTFQSTDPFMEHRTLYDTQSTPNPLFKESIHDILMQESPYYKDVFGKSLVFDGDSIEFITQDFYCTTVDRCVQELMDQKRGFLDAIVPFFKKWKLGEVQFPDHNYGLVSFLSTKKRYVTPCNNSTIHINLTLPTLLRNGQMVDKEGFIKRHLKAVKIIQLIEPLLVACYGTPDVFSVFDSRYSIGSLRVSLSRYISLQTFNTERPQNGKLLLQPRPTDPLHWYSRLAQSSPYVLCDEIGYDVNFNKFKHHGFELRFFDGFPEEYLGDVISFLLLLLSHADTLPSVSFLTSNYHSLIQRCIQKGFTCIMTQEECNMLLRDLQLSDSFTSTVPNPITPYSFLCSLSETLYSMYHSSDLIQKMAPSMQYAPRLVNYNEMAFKQLYADIFSKPQLILRAECSPDEHRTPLIPSHLASLADHFHLIVESSSTRCYSDDAYQRAGAMIVRPGYWEDSMYSFVIGLKAIRVSARATQTLMHFAHCFYQQSGAKETLKNLSACRFIDYETILHSATGERALSFCKPSGKIGCYLALMTCLLQEESRVPDLPPFEEGYYRERLLRAVMHDGFCPRILLIGFGTVGKSAKEILDQLGLECTIWRRSDSKSVTELLQYSIVLHAIRLLPDHSDGIFLSLDHLDQPRKLRVVCDISCDLGHPLNPMPIYSSFTNPVSRIRHSPPLDLIAIDHLPSLDPVISSNVFSSVLKSYLIHLPYFHYLQSICPRSAELEQSYQAFLRAYSESIS